ncbi:MAG: hypothetical protein UV73_C0001G0177 [Candidatus Gottesmanbacteria bacterium GW2011_GWA2_43_14]|uniref:Glycosyltransferase RgtA/B/C/D-like domain-containing protein n=1 Tax=Candidatus Gottesmanbacteria bacterium GW2011_GWA2_43_14 TaxID=1618443 RepID=A0A0G1FUJ5_9BACT|nr:MAG: hypothetical protein UV73_C0001G0177 [Candidatus Gottesmanbacteria bacterium GW2011_GWA2_43_14]
MRSNYKSLILLAGAIFISFVIYRQSLGSYFFQDDWFTLKISRGADLAAIAAFFVPRRDVIYYRPLGMQIPFYLLQSFFGLNQLPFRLLNFVLHAANTVMIYLLIKKMGGSVFPARLSAILYAVSGVHYTVFYWSSTLPFFLGPLLLFSSFYFFLRFSEGKAVWYFLSLTAFILGLFTNEMTAVLPLMLLSYSFIINKISYWRLLPYFVPVAILVGIRFLFFPPPVTESYSLGVARETAYSLRNYFLWSNNWPEEIQGQFYRFGLLNPRFVREFAPYVAVFCLSLAVNILLFYFLPLVHLLKNKNTTSIRFFYFGLSWFLIGLAPVIFFPLHVFSYYLIIPMAGLLLSLTVVFHNYLNFQSRLLIRKVMTIAVVASSIISACALVAFNSKIHWAPRRARISKILTDKAKSVSFGADEKVIFSVKPYSEYKLALNDQDALQYIFSRNDIITDYSLHGLGKFYLSE